MNATKQHRRKTGAKKLEPIDWHEFANDAVLNGNMSTLYHRPATEDPSAYASPEALAEIEKRIGRLAQSAVVVDVEEPTVGPKPTVGPMDRGPAEPSASAEDVRPTVGIEPTVGPHENITGQKKSAVQRPTVGKQPTVRMTPTVGFIPTVGIAKNVKPIRDVQDALTLAGHILYRAMYGAPDGAPSKSCTRGYRQLAAETHLDKDTVRDLISEFKEKGILRETGRYDPDTRSAKTYEVLSYKAILQAWRDAGLQFVTTGRKRPSFCTAQGEPLVTPTVGPRPTVGSQDRESIIPTVGLSPAELISALQQITGSPVDQDAADRLIRNCRSEAPDCTMEEIVEFAWSKAFLCRSGKIENPVGFLITQIPKHFQRDALQSYRENKNRQIDVAAASAARDEAHRRESELELAQMEQRQRIRTQLAERHRVEQGIDVKAVLDDPEADQVMKEWAQAILKLGRRYEPHFD